MSQYDDLKNVISSKIKDNNNQEITGDVLQEVLHEMTDVLGPEQIVQEVGTSDNKVMSQKAVSDAINLLAKSSEEKSAQLSSMITELQKGTMNESDLVVVNSSFVDKYTGGVDDIVLHFDNIGINEWQGTTTIEEDGRYIIFIDLHGNKNMRVEGLNPKGYRACWLFEQLPSNESEMFATVIKKNFYNGTTYSLSSISDNINYVMFDTGVLPSLDSLKISYLSGGVVEKQYELLSFNGKPFLASRLKDVDTYTMDALRRGIVDQSNMFDSTKLIDGIRLFGNTRTIEYSKSSKMYLNAIPKGVKKVAVYGLSGTGYSYYSIAIMDANLNILTEKHFFGSNVPPQDFTITVEESDEVMYLAFNAVEDYLTNTLDDLVVLYNPEDLWYRNIDTLKHHRSFSLNVVKEQPYHNYVADVKHISNSPEVNPIEITTEGGEYLIIRLTESGYQTTPESYVEYDSDGNVLVSMSLNDAMANTTFPIKPPSGCRKKLHSDCKKLKIKPSFGLTPYSARELVALGNLIIISRDGVVNWNDTTYLSEIEGVKVGVPSHPLDGKIIATFGDSITDFGSSASDGSWAAYIQRNYNCAVFNYGKGSAHFVDLAGTDPTADYEAIGQTSTEPNNTISTQIRRMMKEGIVPDIAIITGGTNDAFSVKEIGNLDTAMQGYPYPKETRNTTFYQMCAYAVSMMRSVNPYMKIYFATPIRSLRSEEQRERLKLYVNGFKEASDALGCGLIDFHNKSGIIQYPEVDNIFFADSLHPSQLGVDLMGKLAVKEIVTDL